MQDDSHTESSQNQDDELSQMPVEASRHSQLAGSMSAEAYSQAAMAQSQLMGITFSPPKRIKEPAFDEQLGSGDSHGSFNPSCSAQQEISPNQIQFTFKSSAHASPADSKQASAQKQSSLEE